LSQNRSKEEVDVTITKDSQLYLLIDTATTKIWREPSDLAELASTWPSSAPEHTSSRQGKARESLFQNVIIATTSLMSLEKQTLKKTKRIYEKDGSLLLHLPAVRPPEGQRRGPRGRRCEGDRGDGGGGGSKTR